MEVRLGTSLFCSRVKLLITYSTWGERTGWSRGTSSCRSSSGNAGERRISVCGGDEFTLLKHCEENYKLYCRSQVGKDTVRHEAEHACRQGRVRKPSSVWLTFCCKWIMFWGQFVSPSWRSLCFQAQRLDLEKISTFKAAGCHTDLCIPCEWPRVAPGVPWAVDRWLEFLKFS